jgi:general secretion pathway protein C
MDLAQKKMLMGMLISGTAMGGLGVVTANVAPAKLWPLPNGAELIDPLSGEPIPGDDEDEAQAVSSTVAASLSKPDKRDLIDPIIRRNIFDSSKVGQEAAPETSGEAGNKTSMPLVLLATIVADPARYSSCLISEEKGTDGAVGYGIGDMVLGEAKIHRIEQKRVVLERDGELEYLLMDDAEIDRPSPKSAKGAKGAKKGKWDGVEKDGETKFTIDQETFNKILENPDKLAGQIRAVPHTGDNGKIDGYRLSGIKRSSLFRKLGIKNGDVVHAVNGHDLTSMSSALSAFESLQTERNFNFDVTTRKKKKTYEYEVR